MIPLFVLFNLNSKQKDKISEIIYRLSNESETISEIVSKALKMQGLTKNERAFLFTLVGRFIDLTESVNKINKILEAGK